jgi:hypothetical protein
MKCSEGTCTSISEYRERGEEREVETRQVEEERKGEEQSSPLRPRGVSTRALAHSFVTHLHDCTSLLTLSSLPCRAPSAGEHHVECVQKLKGLHKFDCLRANKSMAAWGVEARVPFLDKEFLDYAMAEISPEDKLCGRMANGRIEKWVSERREI